MSSLYKPFSVSEGPCKDAILRRGCTPQQHPEALTRIASAGGGSTRTFTPIPQIYPGQRNLAAAAIGGRKITHPWKAILAGICVFVFVLEAHNVLVNHAIPYYARAHNNNHAWPCWHVPFHNPYSLPLLWNSLSVQTCISLLGQPNGSFQKFHLFTNLFK